MYVSKKAKKKKIIIISLCAVAAVILGIGTYFGINIARMYGDLGFDPNAVTTDDFETDSGSEDLPEVTLNIPVTTPEPLAKYSGTVDILLLGVDDRSKTSFNGRSDVTMFVRVDLEKGTIKLASFMRDTLVHMEGHSDNKLNTAYRFGSIELAEKTMSDNFGVTPDYFIVVNFFGMEDIIDALGGVDVDIKRVELSYLNDDIKEINDLDKGYNSPYVNKYGVQHLNGRQAVGYMRIRHQGDGDAERIQRQQAVLSEMLKNARNISIGQIPGLIEKLAQFVRTDIPIPKMLEVANAVKDLDISELEAYSFPADYKLGRYKGMSIVLPRDSEEEIRKLHEFLQKGNG